MLLAALAYSRDYVLSQRVSAKGGVAMPTNIGSALFALASLGASIAAWVSLLT